MLTKKNYLLFLISILFALSFQKMLFPDKDSFVPINSNTFNLMELTESKNELYFSYDNKYDGSDIVINLKIAKQYTTRLYIYDSYDNIKTNSDGEYTNYIEELDLSEKLLYIRGCQKKTYYIIIKDLGNYSTKDYFSIYNELDTIELKQNEPFTINLFLSQNLYTFSFTGEKDEVISLDMNIDNRDFSETIAIYLDNEPIYQGERNQGLIKLNEDKTYGGNYKLYISSTYDEIYTEIKSSIILYKEKNEVLKLEPEKEIKLFYINSKTFSFYADINDYELNEENIITMKYSQNAYNNKLIDYCYAKNLNFKEFDDNKFISNMPAHEEDSEANFSKLNTLNNVFHLYFSRTQKTEEEKNSYLLVHCSVKIEEGTYYSPQPISVYLSPRAINLDLSDAKYVVNDMIKVNQNINIDDYIPKVLKVNISISENLFSKLSYVFYTNTQIQTIYEDTMISADHTNEELRQIFAISKNNLENLKKNKIYYIKLFGAKQEIYFKLESTNSDIYYYSDSTRPTKVFSQQHLNCGNSFYYIGNYGLIAKDVNFYLEEIYGKYNIYYKNELSNNEEDLLTNGNNQFLKNEKIGLLSKTFDILELKCEYPGYFNLFLLKSSFYRSLTMYERQVALVSKGETYAYPNVNEGQTKINLEIYTPLGKEIEINIGGTSTIINSENKYFQIKYKKAEDVPNSIKLNVKEDNTLLSVKLTDSNLFKVVDTNHSRINEERILFKLDNNQNYKNANITLKRVSNDYTYTLFRGDISFATDPILNGYEMIPPGEQNYINLIVSNPYIKPYTMTPDKDDSPFYIMFYVYDHEGVQKDVYMEYNPVEQYEKFPNSVSTILDVSQKKYSLDFDKDVSKVSLLYQSCGNALKGINIYSYDDILNQFETQRKYNLGAFHNYLFPSQISPIFEKDEENPYTGAVVGISLNEIANEEIDRYNNYNYTVRQNGKVLKWEAVEGAKEYFIYVFNKDNENIKYIKNPCYLDFVQNNNFFNQNENETTYVACYSSGNRNYYELKENGTYITTVMANIGIPMKFVYNEYKYNSNEEPYDEDKESDSILLIILLILIPLLIILVIVLIIIFIKKKKSAYYNGEDIPEEKTKLVRDTTISSSYNG